MAAGAHGTVERGRLGDGVLLLIEELSARSVDVYVALRAAVLVGLNGSVFGAPAEVPGILRV